MMEMDRQNQEDLEAAQEAEDEGDREPGWVQTLAAMQEGQAGFYEDDEE